MLRGLERLEYLVDAYIRRATTLLDVARSSSQNLQLSYSEVDLSLQVRNSVAAITPAAHSARSSISLDIEENLVGVLDQTAVEQIIEIYCPMPSDTAPVNLSRRRHMAGSKSTRLTLPTRAPLMP